MTGHKRTNSVAKVTNNWVKLASTTCLYIRVAAGSFELIFLFISGPSLSRGKKAEN